MQIPFLRHLQASSQPEMITQDYDSKVITLYSFYNERS